MTAADAPSLAPDFHAQAYDELKARQPERELWAKSVVNSEGDAKRAVSTYVRERARVLQAHADAALPKPVNVWDYRTLLARGGAKPPRDVGVWVGWALIIGMMVAYAVII